MIVKTIRNGSWTIEIYQSGTYHLFSTFSKKPNTSIWDRFQEPRRQGLPIYVNAMVRQAAKIWVGYHELKKEVGKLSQMPISGDLRAVNGQIDTI